MDKIKVYYITQETDTTLSIGSEVYAQDPVYYQVNVGFLVEYDDSNAVIVNYSKKQNVYVEGDYVLEEHIVQSDKIIYWSVYDKDAVQKCKELNATTKLKMNNTIKIAKQLSTPEENKQQSAANLQLKEKFSIPSNIVIYCHTPATYELPTNNTLFKESKTYEYCKYMKAYLASYTAYDSDDDLYYVSIYNPSAAGDIDFITGKAESPTTDLAQVKAECLLHQNVPWMKLIVTVYSRVLQAMDKIHDNNDYL